MKQLFLFTLLALFICTYGQFSHGDAWPVFGQNWESTNYNNHGNIVTFNTLDQLVLKWSFNLSTPAGAIWYASADAASSIRDGVLYQCDSLGRVYAFDVYDGTMLWVTTLSTNFSDQGKVEWLETSPCITDDFVLVSSRNIYALDRRTGAVVWNNSLTGDRTSVGPDGRLTDFWTYSGSINVWMNYVVVGVATTQELLLPSMLINPNNTHLTARGSVACFDLYTGERLWQFFTTSDQTQPNPEYGPGADPWSSPAIDTVRQTIYIGVGNTMQPPISPFSDSILALNITNGNRVWSFQMTSNDAWSELDNQPDSDWDVSTRPNLFTLALILPNTTVRQSYDFVGVGDKKGNYYIFLRDQPSVNATPVAVVSLDPPSAASTLQSSPVIENGMMYICTHDQVNTTTGQRIGWDGTFAGFNYFSSKITAINLVKLIQGESDYIVWSYAEPYGPFKYTMGSLSATQDVLFHPSFGGYITMFRLFDGALSPFNITTNGVPVQTLVTLAQNRICFGTGASALGFYYSGGIHCYGKEYE